MIMPCMPREPLAVCFLHKSVKGDKGLTDSWNIPCRPPMLSPEPELQRSGEVGGPSAATALSLSG